MRARNFATETKKKYFLYFHTKGFAYVAPRHLFALYKGNATTTAAAAAAAAAAPTQEQNTHMHA
jgi:hypothetical protein